MKHLSGWVISAIALLGVNVVVYVWGYFDGKRLIAQGDEFGAAIYLTPLVAMAMAFFSLTASCVALIGCFTGPKVSRIMARRVVIIAIASAAIVYWIFFTPTSIDMLD